MRRFTNVRALWIVVALVAVVALVVLYDPVMDVIFVDRDGIGTELAP